MRGLVIFEYIYIYIYFKGTKFRGFRGLGVLPRNLIPAKISKVPTHQRNLIPAKFSSFRVSYNLLYLMQILVNQCTIFN